VFEIGNSLREARARRGVDFAQAELATKIRGKYLRALEEEQFSLLPAQTYVKGFLRTYAEYLGLDGQLYVDEFNSRYVVGEDEFPARPRRMTVQRGPRVQSRVVVLTLLGIAAVTALVIVAWRNGGAGKTPIAGISTSRTQSTVSTKNDAPQIALARFVVKAVHGPCWLQVHRGSAAGQILFQGTLDLGQTQRFAARRLWITLDRPENVRVILNGHVRALPSGSPRTLVVTPRRILSGT
jgi:hypothetical protein